MSEDLVQLNWNNFDTYITDAVKNLRKDDNLCDVTLVCEDGEIKAHRVILSASSPFFSRVVGKTYNHVHPLLYLRGVSTRILANILDYMYLGVVKIVQEDLSEMLNIASDLKVCGLTTSLEKGTFDTENYLENPFKEVGEKNKLNPFKTDKADSLKISNKKSDDKLDSVGVTADIAEDDEVFIKEEENLSDLGFKEEEKELSLIDWVFEAPPHDGTNKDRILDGMLDNIVIDKIDPLEISDKLDSVAVTADIAEDGEVFIKEEENLSDLEFEEEKELSLMDMELEAPPHDDTNKYEILDEMLDNIVMRKKSKSSGGVFHECRVMLRYM